MLTSYSASYKTWVFAKNGLIENMPIGRLLDFVINPDTGVFEGVWIKTDKLTGILSSKDILTWNEEGIFVSQESDIVKPSEFPRIVKVIEKEVPILGVPVFMEKTKECIGKVSDFSFDTISPRILSIHVSSGFWLFGKRRIIGKQQIVKINKEGIFVKNPSVRITTGSKLDRTLEKKLKSSVDIIERSIENK